PIQYQRDCLWCGGRPDICLSCGCHAIGKWRTLLFADHAARLHSGRFDWFSDSALGHRSRAKNCIGERMNRPVHFEIPAKDPARAIKFYEGAFGWTFKKWDGPMPYWMITTGPGSEPGINGG